MESIEKIMNRLEITIESVAEANRAWFAESVGSKDLEHMSSMLGHLFSLRGNSDDNVFLNGIKTTVRGTLKFRDLGSSPLFFGDSDIFNMAALEYIIEDSFLELSKCMDRDAILSLRATHKEFPDILTEEDMDVLIKDHIDFEASFKGIMRSTGLIWIWHHANNNGGMI